MATFPDEKVEETTEEVIPEITDEVVEEVPEEITQEFIDDVDNEVKELSKQIQRARLAEKFYRSRVKYGKPEEKATIKQLASVQQRLIELASQHNHQADFVDYLRSLLAEKK